MALSWNEIKRRSIDFSNEWADESREHAEAKSFWDAFFHVFGIERRRIASFEEPVKKLDDRYGFIDLFWKGTLLVEHKSRGKDLDKAYSQALDYFAGLKDYELPKYILVSDFEHFRLYDLDDDKQYEFTIDTLHDNVHLFSFVAGYTKKNYRSEDPVNIKAAELMGKLHDYLYDANYQGHDLEVLLVRILFCLFADDTGIFDKNIFCDYIEQKTAEDGSNLGMHLAHLFQILDTPVEQRSQNLDESLNAFSYINGKLFKDILPVAAFNPEMRDALLEACYFEWSKISPAVFGSLFQSVMNQKERREVGAHYTSEQNILKLINPLFLDELQQELEQLKRLKRGRKQRLEVFHEKLAKLKFLDPACGCGNFLVITYRELRLLEIEIIKILHKDAVLDIGYYCKINVDQMYGIEIEEFPARIAEVAMWLVDHQMNIRLSEEFGMYYVRLPLNKSANIHHGNALQLDWNYLLHGSYFDVSADTVNVAMIAEPSTHYETINVSAKTLNVIDESEIKKQQQHHQTKFDYILGNPPFIGKHLRSSEQNIDMDAICSSISNFKTLDYVTCWYLKAAEYIQGTGVKVAFVSTNSISQGEQVGILWYELFNKYHIKIHFAHRTFSWTNEARGKAHVHVVIIGFSTLDIPVKRIFEYENIKGESHELIVNNISPYLIDYSDTLLHSRTKPLCDIPVITAVIKPVDGGNLLLNADEREKMINSNIDCQKFIMPLISSKEYLNGQKRYCLWLDKITPAELTKIPEILSRVQAVKEFRLQSKKQATRAAAATPTLFAEYRLPYKNFILVPLTTSENRKYIPLDFFAFNCIVNNTSSIIPNATLFHFGVLMSEMHMAWVKYVCGRLESRYRYSNKLVYNNYPWPENTLEAEQTIIAEKAQAVLTARALYPDSSLAELYSPLTMPPNLLKAHNELDKAVDKCYSKTVFKTEMERLEFLFDLYQKYIDGSA
jgi:type I restriction-modification system DNA methylase subunit